MRGNSHVRFCRRVGEGDLSRLASDQRTLHGGQFLVKLRTAYSEQVVAEVTRRLHGTARRTVEGHLVKIQVRY
ncbi:MAG TPA: hypothetical protein VFS96_00405 [Nitrolancea sp.]|nr:hypothetical protein [Nitrolancea sp.]